MKKISQEELKEKLELHKKWLNNEKGGVRLNLRNTDLRHTNLNCADLRYADLEGVNLSYANLEGANLNCADLRYADLYGTNLKSAYLKYADLEGVNLRNANLYEASLRYANLRYANLRYANLKYADLEGVNLEGVDLSCADLRGASLTNAKLNNIKYNHLTSFLALQCPEKGSFIAYKKAKDINSDTEVIVELLVMEDSLRSSATSRKCRFSHTKTLSITSLDGTVEYNIACSMRDENFIYTVGKENIIENFNEDRWNECNECSTGIHGFITRDEAVNY